MKSETRFSIYAIIVLILSLTTLGYLVMNNDCQKPEEQVMWEEAERVVED